MENVCHPGCGFPRIINIRGNEAIDGAEDTLCLKYAAEKNCGHPNHGG